jgi:hypothetical protein
MIISNTVQSRWRACLPTSEQARLTLYVTGEERTQVITPGGGLVEAGFDAPTAAATLSSGAAGGPPAGIYYYVYVYASSQYPYVQNAQTTADGELWPRSNPSPISAAISGGNIVTVTVTKTTRADVDKILVYRTAGQGVTVGADALALAQAGLYYYVATVANNGSPGTTTVTDNGLVDTGELLELDNYKANTAWFSVFDGKYWWMAGNPELILSAGLDGTSIVTVRASIPAFCTVAGGATHNGTNVDGIYTDSGNTYNDQIIYVRDDGLFKIYQATGTSSGWTLTAFADTPGSDFWFGGTAVDDPSSTPGNPYQASGGGASGIPTVALTLAVPVDPRIGEVAIFDGRNGQVATFDGVTNGGFDGRGSFYIGVNSGNEITLYSDAELTSPLAIAYSGRTLVHIRGRSSVLYRSKPFNPFSWGLTEVTLREDGSTQVTPQSFALELGGGSVCAMAVSNNGKLLIVHFENPQRTISLDLELAESDQFGDTLKIIDDTNSVTCHFTQFHGQIGDTSILLGLDTFNGNVLACDGYRQQIISSAALGDFLLSLDRTDNAHRFFHGEFDPTTQLNCFWVRFYDTTETCNVLVWNHADSGQWGWTPDFNVSCSAVCQDPTTNERFVLGGSENGHLGRLFNTEFYDNWLNGMSWKLGIVNSTSLSGGFYIFDTDFSFLSEGQAISYPDDIEPTFTTTGTPSMGVGDTVILFREDDFAIQSQTVIAISGNTITIDEPWSGGSPAPTFAMVSGERHNGVWAVIAKADGTNWWWCQLQFTGANNTEDHVLFGWRVTSYFERGTTEIFVTNGATPPWAVSDKVYFGAIACLYRTYFDLNTPTKDKRIGEIWTTAEDVTGPTFSQYTGRYYQEFDEDSTAARTFDFERTIRTANQGSANSNVWMTKTGMPTSSLRQFGFEISHLGYDPFTLFNYTLKIKPS